VMKSDGRITFHQFIKIATELKRQGKLQDDNRGVEWEGRDPREAEALEGDMVVFKDEDVEDLYDFSLLDRQYISNEDRRNDREERYFSEDKINHHNNKIKHGERNNQEAIYYQSTQNFHHSKNFRNKSSHRQSGISQSPIRNSGMSQSPVRNSEKMGKSRVEDSERKPRSKFLAGLMSLDLSAISRSPLPSVKNSNIKQESTTELDKKVIDILTILEEYRLKCELSGKYQEAARARKKFEEIKEKELTRIGKARTATNEREFQNLVRSQEVEFGQFVSEWETYTNSYNKAADLAIRNLNVEQKEERSQIIDGIKSDQISHYRHSKELLEARRKEFTLIQIRQYQAADICRKEVETLEAQERTNIDAQVRRAFHAKEKSLNKAQRNAFNSLVNRIEKDRTEQNYNKEKDQKLMVQKHKNAINELISKQNLERKKVFDHLNKLLSKARVYKSAVKKDMFTEYDRIREQSHSKLRDTNRNSTINESNTKSFSRRRSNTHTNR